MTEITAALEALRREIQIDRIELQRSITEGTQHLSDKFTEHSMLDDKRFEEINNKLSIVETKVNTVHRLAGGTIIAVFGAALKWLFPISIPK